jgi:hypothetical protein
MDTFSTTEAILLLIANAVALIMLVTLIGKLMISNRMSTAPLPVIDKARGIGNVD